MTESDHMRAPTAYYGGKARLASTIVELLPDHRCYTEPYAGALSVLLAKPPATHEVVNDIDGHVVNFWRQLRDWPDELARLCAATPYARDEYDACVDLDIEDDMERARRWWVMCTQSFGQDATGRTGWSYSVARASSAGRTLNASDRMPALAKRMRNVVIENRDATEVICSYDGPDTVHYVDPPYPAQARNSVGYRHEMPDERDHRVLIEVLREAEGTVVLSGYRCPLYDELVGDWWALDVPTTKSNGGIAGNDQQAVETLWSNRDLTVAPSLFGGAA